MFPIGWTFKGNKVTGLAGVLLIWWGMVSCVAPDTKAEIATTQESIAVIEKEYVEMKISQLEYDSRMKVERQKLSELQKKASNEKLQGWSSGLDVAGTSLGFVGKLFSSVPLVSIIAGVAGSALKMAKDKVDENIT